MRRDTHLPRTAQRKLLQPGVRIDELDDSSVTSAKTVNCCDESTCPESASEASPLNCTRSCPFKPLGTIWGFAAVFTVPLCPPDERSFQPTTSRPLVASPPIAALLSAAPSTSFTRWKWTPLTSSVATVVPV